MFNLIVRDVGCYQTFHIQLQTNIGIYGRKEYISFTILILFSVVIHLQNWNVKYNIINSVRGTSQLHKILKNLEYRILIRKYIYDCIIWICALNISSIPIALSFLFLSIKAVNTWVIYIKSKAKKVLSVQFPCVSIHTHIVTKRNIQHFFFTLYICVNINMVHSICVRCNL